MLDTVIGPITNVTDRKTFQINVTHIGEHNKFHYNSHETISVATNETGFKFHELIGSRVSCHIKHRDIYNRLIADVYLE